MPFSSEEKWMAVQCRPADVTDISSLPPSLYPSLQTNLSSIPLYYAKGSADAIIRRCSQYYISDDDIRPLDPSTKNQILTIADKVASEGLRILFFAFGVNTEDMIFVGFVGMYDPPRQGIEETMKVLKAGGVKIVMITGDSGKKEIFLIKKIYIYKVKKQGEKRPERKVDFYN